MLTELDVSQNARWKQRFRVPGLAWTQIAAQNPDHGLVCTNKDGQYQLYAWDVPTGTLKQLTHHSAGVTFGVISADGESVYYLDDQQGYGTGHFVKIPFEWGTAQDITPAMPDYASWYLTESHSGNIIGMTAAAQEWGYRIYVMKHSGEIIFTYESEHQSAGPNLSHDGTIAVIASNERSGTSDTMLEAYDTGTGSYLGELYDGENISVSPVGFLPKAGEEWYLAKTNKSGLERPVLWHPRTGERRDLTLEHVHGNIQPLDWTEDGRYLLLLETWQAQHQLYLYDLENNTLITLDHPAGTIADAYFVGDDAIYLNLQDASQPARIIAVDFEGNFIKTVLAIGDAPPANTWDSVTFASADGVQIQAWLVKPESDEPLPAIVHMHGGPADALTHSYHAGFQSWVDHGFAVLGINYRGSTTFGKPYQDAILGKPGELELEDMVAGVEWLVDNQIAHPDQIFATGAGYGGSLTLLALSKQPDLWAGGMAVSAIADWVLAYEDLHEMLRAYQDHLFGGTPGEVANQIEASSAITYTDQINAPLQIIQGSNDSRFPARQMQVYEEKLTALGKDLDMIWMTIGHGSNPTTRAIEIQEHQLRFAYRVLGD